MAIYFISNSTVSTLQVLAREYQPILNFQSSRSHLKSHIEVNWSWDMVAIVISPTPSLGILTSTATPRWYQQQAKTLIPVSTLSSPCFHPYTKYLHFSMINIVASTFIESEKENKRILNPSAISTKPFLDKEYIRMFWQSPAFRFQFQGVAHVILQRPRVPLLSSNEKIFHMVSLYP